MGFAASRLKKTTPGWGGSGARRVTYVLTFSSGKAENHGAAGNMPRTHAGHAKRDDAKPGCAVEGIDIKMGRDMRPQFVHGDGPMCEEEVMPRLAHGPAALWERPGTVRDRCCGVDEHVAGS